MENIEINCHSSIKIIDEKIVYVDPFRVSKVLHDADFIFITHSHYDHFSPEDIEKVINSSTIIIVPSSMSGDIEGLYDNKIIEVEPDTEYSLEGIKFTTTYAYNKKASFHPKANKWVGYVIGSTKKYYIAGDTDNVEEISKIDCDVALLPIGGTYTMDYEEAANLANVINTKLVIPTHYGEIVGNKEDSIKFKSLVIDKNVAIKL